jgi:hypothetical protein
MSQNLNSGIDINDDFKACILEMEQSDTPCLFITGKAGTGKSTLLQHWRKTTQKNIVVLAPTGIAALNVEGQTIHSFFGFPPRPLKKRRTKYSKESPYFPIFRRDCYR